METEIEWWQIVSCLVHTEKTSWLFLPQSGYPGCNPEWVTQRYLRLIAQSNQRGSCSDHLTTTILPIVTTNIQVRESLASIKSMKVPYCNFELHL